MRRWLLFSCVFHFHQQVEASSGSGSGSVTGMFDALASDRSSLAALLLSTITSANLTPLFFFLVCNNYYMLCFSPKLQLNDLLTFGQHRIWKRMAVSWSGAKTGDNVLDVCCGSGDLSFLLSEQVGSHGKVIGLDFSKDQLSVASSRQGLLSKACYKNIE